MKKQASFEDFQVYKDSLSIFVQMFTLLQRENLKKEFGLADQLKRATLSISNNIAEGFERETDKELIRFLYFAKGSAGEVRNVLNILKEINYIEESEYNELRMQVLDISKQLSNFIKHVVKRNETRNS